MTFALPNSRRITGHSALAARCVSLCLAIALVACGGGGALSKELDTAASWTATARMTAEARRTGAITRTYTAQVGAEAKQALLQMRQTEASAEHDARVARRVAASLDSLERAILALDAESSR